MNSRDVIKLYLIDQFSKNYNFRKMTFTDISRRFAYDMGISLTTRLYRKFKKVTIEFLEEILDTESEFENSYPVTEDPDQEEISITKISRNKKKNSGNVEESKSKPIQKVVQRKQSTENEENQVYYSTLNVFKKTGLPLPRNELTEAKSTLAKIAVLESAMKNAGFEGDFSIENAILLKERLAQ